MNPCKNEYLFQAGEYVSYKKNGICKITDVVTKEFAGMDPKPYYEMEVVYDNHTVLYVPVGSPAEQSMRRVLTAEEVHAVILESEQYQDPWIENGKARAAQFEAMLEEGTRSRILWIIKMLTFHRAQAERENKKVYAADVRILETAEKIITEEFSFALKIEKEQVIPYIIDHLQSIKQAAG